MKFNCSTPAEILKEIKDLDVKMVDMRFTDMPGTTHHFTIPIKFLDVDIFEDGLGFDSSSVRGFQAIENSDMIVIPDVTTAYIDPFFSEKRLLYAECLWCLTLNPLPGLFVREEVDNRVVFHYKRR